MGDHEELRRRHVADMQRLAPRLVDRLDWPTERLAEHRTAELRSLLKIAVDRSPWHRRRLAGIDIGRIDERRLGELPMMTKDDLMEHFDEIATDDQLDRDAIEAHLDRLTGDGYLHDRYHALASGVSSGRRGVFVYDWDAWTLAYLGIMRYEMRAWIRHRPAGAPISMAVIAAGRPTHGSSAIFRSFSSAALSLHRFPVGSPIDQTVSNLNRLQPMILTGYPPALFALARAASAGDLRISPQRILTGGEPLLPEMRACLEETFGVTVCNWWAASEACTLAIGCGEGPWMHLSDDLVIVEPVDAEGRPVPTGERSAKVLLTNLYNRAFPLIRYELTDEVTFLDRHCPCGSPFRLMADVEGRLDDEFTYQGVHVHPHVFRSPLSRQRHVTDYQVRQTPSGADVLVRVGGPVDLEALRSEIVDELARLVEAPEVSIVEVDAIPRQDSGKLKRFVPLAPAACRK
jgi:phenylacetate-CoA ligase